MCLSEEGRDHFCPKNRPIARILEWVKLGFVETLNANNKHLGYNIYEKTCHIHTQCYNYVVNK